MMVQRAFRHFADIQRVFRHRAARQFFTCNQALLRVQKQRQAHFHALVPDTQPQIIAGCLRRLQQRLLLQLLAQHAPPDFQHRGKLRERRRAHAFVL